MSREYKPKRTIKIRPISPKAEHVGRILSYKKRLNWTKKDFDDWCKEQKINPYLYKNDIDKLVEAVDKIYNTWKSKSTT